MGEGSVDAHLNTVLRPVVGGSLLLVSVRKDHELDRFLLEKQKHEFSAKKRKRGSADDPICHLFGNFVVVIGKAAGKIFAGSARQIHAPAASAASSRRDTET